MERGYQRDLPAQTENYIPRLSSVLAAVCKLAEGAAAGYALYNILAFAMTSIRSLSDITKLIEKYSEQFFGTTLGLDDIYSGVSSIIKTGGPFFMILFIVISVLVILSLILVVAEALSSLLLVTVRTGASLIRMIELVYFGFSILSLIVYVIVEVISFIQAILARKEMKDSFVPMLVVMGIVFVIGLIIQILVLSYHKDLALAMGTASYELKTGMADPSFERTHLSGISVFFSIPYILSFLAILINGIRLISEHHMDFPMYLFLIYLAVPLIFFIKQLAVSFCYRNQKRAR